jgi:hypothetical protein
VARRRSAYYALVAAFAAAPALPAQRALAQAEQDVVPRRDITLTA